MSYDCCMKRGNCGRNGWIVDTRLLNCQIVDVRGAVEQKCFEHHREQWKTSEALAPWPDFNASPGRFSTHLPHTLVAWENCCRACLTYCELTPDRYRYAPRPAIRYKIWPSNNQLNDNSPTFTRPPVHPVVCSLFQIPRRQDSETNVLDSRGLTIWPRFLFLCCCLYPWDCLGCWVTVNLLLCLD